NVITTEQLKLLCFDKHYSLSHGLFIIDESANAHITKMIAYYKLNAPARNQISFINENKDHSIIVNECIDDRINTKELNHMYKLLTDKEIDIMKKTGMFVRYTKKKDINSSKFLYVNY
ncbi:MAG: hypothetical protein KDH96_07325, partial [Candidatus Riesia sp.]|nr:hypothetical protein [Candidatus Riesia sp.]